MEVNHFPNKFHNPANHTSAMYLQSLQFKSLLADSISWHPFHGFSQTHHANNTVSLTEPQTVHLICVTYTPPLHLTSVLWLLYMQQTPPHSQDPTSEFCIPPEELLWQPSHITAHVPCSFTIVLAQGQGVIHKRQHLSTYLTQQLPLPQKDWKVLVCKDRRQKWRLSW